MVFFFIRDKRNFIWCKLCYGRKGEDRNLYRSRDYDLNKNLFDTLKNQLSEIEKEYGSSFEWERLDNKRSCRIAIYCDGVIDAPDSELEQLRGWHIENLLKLKKSFLPHIQSIMKQKHNNANEADVKKPGGLP